MQLFINYDVKLLFRSRTLKLMDPGAQQLEPEPNLKILVEPRTCVIPKLELLLGLPAM